MCDTCFYFEHMINHVVRYTVESSLGTTHVINVPNIPRRRNQGLPGCDAISVSTK